MEKNTKAYSMFLASKYDSAVPDMDHQQDDYKRTLEAATKLFETGVSKKQLMENALTGNTNDIKRAESNQTMLMVYANKVLGMSYRRISELTGVHHQTVSSRINGEAGETAKHRIKSVVDNEMDELFSEREAEGFTEWDPSKGHLSVWIDQQDDIDKEDVKSYIESMVHEQFDKSIVSDQFDDEDVTVHLSTASVSSDINDESLKKHLVQEVDYALEYMKAVMDNVVQDSRDVEDFNKHVLVIDILDSGQKYTDLHSLLRDSLIGMYGYADQRWSYVMRVLQRIMREGRALNTWVVFTYTSDHALDTDAAIMNLRWDDRHEQLGLEEV